MLDLLPTSATAASFFIWLVALLGIGTVTLVTVGVSERVENERQGWIVLVPPVALVALSLVNLRLLIAARDVFWSDTWMSVFLLIVAVVVVGVFAAFGASQALEDAELTIWAIVAAAIVSGAGSLLWGVGHLVDTIAQALPPLGVIVVVVILIWGLAARD
ncbi:MAG: hypothetical protein L0G89_00060 [Janibacter sp.]|nr:hypothetical protein [Janibacter sp.]